MLMSEIEQRDFHWDIFSKSQTNILSLLSGNSLVKLRLIIYLLFLFYFVLVCLYFTSDFFRFLINRDCST